MNKLPALFRSYLLYKKALTKVTAKNYTSDIRRFIKWFEASFKKEFQSADFTPDVIKLFEESGGRLIPYADINSLQAAQAAPRSRERYLSSLRKFAEFLLEEGYLEENPFDQVSDNKPQSTENDPWLLKDFKNYLYVSRASSLTIKNYLVDINAFTTWLDKLIKNDLNISKLDIRIPSITPEIIKFYKETLIARLKLSPKTINRKLSAIRRYLDFAASRGFLSWKIPISDVRIPISEKSLKLDDIKEEFAGQAQSMFRLVHSKIPPIRLLQKLLIPYLLFEDAIASKISAAIRRQKLEYKAKSLTYQKLKNVPERIPLHRRLIYHAKYTRPKWYIKYHNYAFSHYFHLAILIIYASLIGYMLYNSLILNPRDKSAFAGPVAPLRVLSFQGRLTDADGNPITSATDIRFAIYEKETATGSALLWQEVHNAVTPDADGVFSLLLGTKNGIQGSLFRDHDLLWLGITIGTTPELTPRQRLAAVSYAANSESLQGMLPITDSSAGTTNVVLALDSSGNLTIGGTAAPTFAATGGQFKLSGTTLMLSTQTGSDGDVEINPDGLGKINLQKPIVNTSAAGNLIGGAVEFNDNVAILATESAAAALVIENNTTGGDILAASSSGVTRFVIQNNGDISFVAGAALDTISTGTLSIGNITATTITIGRSGQGITLPGFTGTNGVLYGADGTGALAQAATSTPNLCLVSGTSAPSWASCESTGLDVFWNQGSGSLFPNNSTVDLLVGGQSTSSAKFAILNLASGTPTASLSANSGNNAAYLTGTGNLATTNGQTLTIGGSTTGNIVIDSGASSVTISDRLMLSSNITESNTGQYLCVNTVTFEVGRNNSACSLSSARFKENINDLSHGLSDVLRLHPVTFTFKPEMNLGGNLQVGFIAEEVAKVIPELVSYDNQGRPSGVNYPNMTALLAKALQELNAKVEEYRKSATLFAAHILQLTADSLAVTTDSVTIAGQSLRDYILAVVNEAGITNQESSIVSGIAGVDQVHTNVISPLAQNSELAVSLNDSKFMIHDSATSSGSVVASIDNQGNATFSGTLSSNSASVSGQLAASTVASDQLTVSNDATISGTLYANRIQANSIEGLEARIASVAAEKVSSMQHSVSSESANIASILNSQYSMLNANFIDISNLSVDFATFREGLIALGPTTISQATVLDSLSIGTTLTIGPNSINTLGYDLEIQPLRQGTISFMAGAVRIETDGTLRVTGNAEFAGIVRVEGNLSTDLISPLANESLVISRSASEETASASSALLDVQGSASISGALTSRKINLAFAEQAFATSDTEAVATGSAGFAVLRQYRNEITIKNPNVTEKSLIYITPVGNTNNKVLYLLRQVPENLNTEEIEGSFTVGVNSPSTASDIKFNWLIVN